MPKTILPAEQMEKELSDQLRQGVIDLSGLMVQTASVWIQRALEREREEFLGRRWAERTVGTQGRCLMLCHAVIVELSRKKPWRGLPIAEWEGEQLQAIRQHLSKYQRGIEGFEQRNAA